MGSVKDLVVLEEPAGMKTGRGRFFFSDRYSVFDWGEMPDLIEGKGKALCMIGAFFFEALESMGIDVHYLGVCDEDGRAGRMGEAQSPCDTMEVKLLRVLHPRETTEGYDYSAYGEEQGNFLIPLEVIYRNSLPEGSSVFRRIEEGSLDIADLGLKKLPEPGQKLEEPILDVSTKLESTDRYLSWKEAAEIARLSREELEKVKEVTLKVNELITRTVEPLGLSNEDGKLEFGFDEKRRLLLVDVLGTPDECRFEYRGMPVSKEIARSFYRDTDWARELEEAKRRYGKNWKSMVKTSPPPLPERLREQVALIYQSCCNGITGRAFFDAPPISEILEELVKGS